MVQDKHFHSKSYKQGNTKVWNQSKSKIQQDKTLSPVVPCPASEAICGKLWTPKGLCRSTLTALLVVKVPTASLLGWLCSLLTGFLRQSMLLAFPNFWSLHCTFGFTLKTSHTALSGIYCLASQAFWNQGESLPNPTTAAFCVHLKPVLYGWCQGLLPATAVARLPSLLAEGVKCLHHWALWIQFWETNFLCHCHSGTWCYTAFSSKQSLTFAVWRLQKGGDLLLLVMPSGHLFYCLIPSQQLRSQLSLQCTALLELPFWPNSHFHSPC